MIEINCDEGRDAKAEGFDMNAAAKIIEQD